VKQLPRHGVEKRRRNGRLMRKENKVKEKKKRKRSQRN
jgi:hypothetical protein